MAKVLCCNWRVAWHLSSEQQDSVEIAAHYVTTFEQFWQASQSRWHCARLFSSPYGFPPIWLPMWKKKTRFGGVNGVVILSWHYYRTFLYSMCDSVCFDISRNTNRECINFIAFMEHIFSWKAHTTQLLKRFSAFYNLRFYCFYKSPPLIPMLSQMNPSLGLSSYLF